MVLNTHSEPYWREQQTAQFLGIEIKTLQKWRSSGKGPPFCRFGRMIRYKPTEVRAWADTQNAH